MAALLTQEVFPGVPLRAVGDEFPFPLRYLFAAHPQEIGKVLGSVHCLFSRGRIPAQQHSASKEAGGNRRACAVGAFVQE